MNFLKKIFGLGKKNDVEQTSESVPQQNPKTNPKIVREGNFAVHKKGFFYTDEAFEETKGAKGSIIGFYATKEDAKKAIEEADIKTMLSMAGNNAVDFFFYSKEYDKVYAEFEAYLKNKFDITIEDKFYFSFPKDMERTDAIKFLELLDQSFHFVVEYDSIEGIDPNGFRQKLWDEDSDEF